MEWVAIAKLILDNAPAAISAVDDAFEWGLEVWADWQKTTGRDASTVTPDELIAHIANFKRSSGAIQAID